MENPKSAKVYAYYCNQLITKCLDNIEPVNMLDEEIVEKILNYVNSLDKSISTKTGLLNSWRKIASTKGHQGDLTKIEKELKKLNDDYAYREPTKKEKDNKITKSDIEKLRDFYKIKSAQNAFGTFDINYLLCCLYSYILPLRSEDYYNSVIYEIGGDDVDVDSDNYYDVQNKTLVLNHYKTSKAHGKREVVFPDELHQVVMNFHQKSGSQYLICSTKSEQMTSPSFTMTFKRCMKKDVSSTMIRKCILSDKIDGGMSANERKEASRVMGHSVSTQQIVYSRFSDVLHPEKDELDYWIRRNQQLTEQLKEAEQNILRITKQN